MDWVRKRQIAPNILWQNSHLSKLIKIRAVFVNSSSILPVATKLPLFLQRFSHHLPLHSRTMKKIIVVLSCLFAVFSLAAQNKTLPAANVKTPEGQTIAVKDLAPEGQLTVFSFWATWCKPCIAELDAIKDLYPEWKEKYGVEFVAVSVDDARTLARVKTFATNKAWEYTIVTDASKEFQTAMNVSNPPLTVLVNEKGEIIFEHLGYTSGNEIELEEKIKEAAKK